MHFYRKLNYQTKNCLSDKDKLNELNQFFTNIVSKIPKIQKIFKSYLTDQNPEYFCVELCNTGEIIDIINNLQTSKAVGLNIIPTKLLKLKKNFRILNYYLKKLIF